MNKKAFTLVELLAVIVVLGILSTIGIASISGVIESAKKKTRQEQIAVIEKAAKEWALENTDKLSDNLNGTTTVSVEALVEAGKLEKMPKDPTATTSSEMNGFVKITCEKVSEGFCISYTYNYIG